MTTEHTMRIGALSITKVRPDMVRIYNEITADAITIYEWELEDALELMIDVRG